MSSTTAVPSASASPAAPGATGAVAHAELRVIDAQLAHLPAVQAIYADYVLTHPATFEEEPPDVAEMARRRAAVLVLGCPYLVALEGDTLLGYAYASSYRARSAYRHTIENSIYVARGRQRRGVGRALLGELVRRCEHGPWHTMIAVIGDSANTASIGLHAAAGFSHVGVLREVGFKFGKWHDSVLMQRQLNPRG